MTARDRAVAFVRAHGVYVTFWALVTVAVCTTLAWGLRHLDGHLEEIIALLRRGF